MKTQLPLLLALSLTALSACASPVQHQTAATATRYGALPEIGRKMERGDVLSLTDLGPLAQAHLPEDEVLAYLRQTNASCRFKITEIDQLRGQGVSDRIIDYLPTTPTRVVRPLRGYVRDGAWYHGFGHGGSHHGGHQG